MSGLSGPRALVNVFSCVWFFNVKCCLALIMLSSRLSVIVSVLLSAICSVSNVENVSQRLNLQVCVASSLVQPETRGKINGIFESVSFDNPKSKWRFAIIIGGKYLGIKLKLCT